MALKEFSGSILDKFDNLRKKEIHNLRFKKLLPKIYTRLVLTGFVLTGLQATFLPKLVICSSLFGNNICDPLGNYLITFVSLPGYILSGLLTIIWPNAPGYIFFLVLFLVSVFTYFLIGAFFDRLKTVRNKSLASIYLIVFAALFVLFLMVAILI